MLVKKCSLLVGSNLSSRYPQTLLILALFLIRVLNTLLARNCKAIQSTKIGLKELDFQNISGKFLAKRLLCAFSFKCLVHFINCAFDSIDHSLFFIASEHYSGMWQPTANLILQQQNNSQSVEYNPSHCKNISPNIYS